MVNRSGVPDIICCLNGKFIAFEVKAEKGKITPLQEYNIQAIKVSDGNAYVVRSVEEVKEILSKIIF